MHTNTLPRRTLLRSFVSLFALSVGLVSTTSTAAALGFVGTGSHRQRHCDDTVI